MLDAEWSRWWWWQWRVRADVQDVAEVLSARSEWGGRGMLVVLKWAWDELRVCEWSRQMGGCY
jgi:hypothetical protein